MYNNLRYALRQLVKTPGFTVAAVVTLALGIGASTAIFSVLHAVLLRALPYRQAERLVAVWQMNLERQARDKATCADYADWKARNHVFEDIAYSMDEPYTLTDRTGAPQSVIGFQFSTNLFALLGAQPLLGRTLLPEEGEPGKDHVIVLSHRLWERRFASDRSVVGRSVNLNGEPYTIVGVMPPEFAHPGTFVDLWTPLALASNWFENRKLHILHIVARLRDGVGLSRAQKEMETLAGELARQYPDTNKNWGTRLAPIRDLYTGNLREALWVLQAAVFLMLIIACANVANMLLAQASSREREVAIRLALGARRRHLFSQFLTQGLILTWLGAAGGLLLAFWGVQVLPQLFSTQLARMPLPTQPSEWIDWPVLLFALATAVIAGVVFGLMPAFRAPRLPQEMLKAGIRGATGHALPVHLRSVLIVAQVALSLMLLAGSGLLIRRFLRLQKQSLGFQTDQVAACGLLLAQNRYPDGNATTIFLEQVLARLKAAPLVESAAAISTLPLSGNDARRPFTVPGRPEEQGRPNIARFRLVTPDYFQTMRIPLKRGRVFDERDRTGSAEVVILSEGLALRFFPNEDPIGKIISVPDMATPGIREIVGVVGDVRHYGLAEQAPVEIYRPFYQARWPFFTIVARSSLDPAQLANTIRQAIASVDKDQVVQSVRMMDELASDSVALRRASMVLLAIFAAVAVLLAGLGIYSVMSYTVAQRTQEIGIRMALGARPWDVLRLVTREAILLALAGVIFGLLGAFALTRFLGTLLYSVQPTDPVTFLGVSVLLTFVALLASYLPARRAAKVDP